ncbi:MAG TPA: nucleotidyltransferase domain-containing protein [Clostridia bacterium]|nr:nucleotidyltransferase domain-containing protein [Clostridia bacterium]
MRNNWETLDPAILGLLTRLGRSIAELPGAERMVLYGSYAKGTNTEESDVDLAVFFRGGGNSALLEEYRRLARICATDEYDVQVQAFSSDELANPCGIIEEIDAHGVELPLKAVKIPARGGRE